MHCIRFEDVQSDVYTQSLQKVTGIGSFYTFLIKRNVIFIHIIKNGSIKKRD